MCLYYSTVIDIYINVCGLRHVKYDCNVLGLSLAVPPQPFLPLFSLLQEVSSLGLPPAWTESGGSSEMNVVAVLNCMYDLIQLHRRGLRTLENMEVEQLKTSSNVNYLQFTSTQLKVQ